MIQWVLTWAIHVDIIVFFFYFHYLLVFLHFDMSDFSSFQVLCEDRVYMFDVLSLGPALFTQEFINILESTSIAKVTILCYAPSNLYMTLDRG